MLTRFLQGGLNDYQERLGKEGHDVRTAVVGPISSNWDRACELYAYLKGGRVDYGEAHAARFRHQRSHWAIPEVVTSLRCWMAGMAGTSLVSILNGARWTLTANRVQCI